MKSNSKVQKIILLSAAVLVAAAIFLFQKTDFLVSGEKLSGPEPSGPAGGKVAAGEDAVLIPQKSANGELPGEKLIVYEKLDKEQRQVVDELSSKGWQVKIFLQPDGKYRINMKGKDREASADASLKFPIKAEEWREIEDEMIAAINKEEGIEDDKTAEEIKFIEDWKKRSRE